MTTSSATTGRSGPSRPMPDTCRGVGVGVGIVVAPLVRMGRPPALPRPRRSTTPGRGRARPQGPGRGERRPGRPLAGGEGRDRGHHPRRPQHDRRRPELTDQVDGLIDGRTDAPHALHQAFEGYRAMLTEAGGYLAERAHDLDDIRDRAVAVALGLPMPGVPDPGHPFVLVAEDLVARRHRGHRHHPGPRPRDRGRRPHQPHRDPGPGARPPVRGGVRRGDGGARRHRGGGRRRGRPRRGRASTTTARPSCGSGRSWSRPS